MRNQQTKDLIAEIENPSNGASANLQMPAVGKVNEYMMLKSEHHKTQQVEGLEAKTRSGT